MNFLDDYSDLLHCAKNFLYKFQITSAEPAELVNDAFITYFETGEEYNKEKFKYHIIKVGYKELDNKKSLKYINANGEIIKSSLRLESKVCTQCKESIPIMHFRIVHKKNGYQFTLPFCKDCEHEIKINWFRKNRDKWNAYLRSRRVKKGKPIRDHTIADLKVCAICKNTLSREKFGLNQPYCKDCASVYADKYYNSKKKIILSKAKDRFQIEKESLHDNYIRKVLRNLGYANDYILNNPYLITEKREQIANKRKKNVSKKLSIYKTSSLSIK